MSKSLVTYRFDFEALFHSYPRKEGKGRGLKRLAATIKTQKQFDAFKEAMTNYLSMCLAEKREAQYIKHWITFVNNWTDYQTKEGVIESVTTKTILRSQAERIMKGEL